MAIPDLFGIYFSLINLSHHWMGALTNGSALASLILMMGISYRLFRDPAYYRLKTKLILYWILASILFIVQQVPLFRNWSPMVLFSQDLLHSGGISLKFYNSLDNIFRFLINPGFLLPLAFLGIALSLCKLVESRRRIVIQLGGYSALAVPLLMVVFLFVFERARPEHTLLLVIIRSLLFSAAFLFPPLLILHQLKHENPQEE